MVKRGPRLLALLAFLALLLQLFPYGRDHSNPPVRRQPAWDPPATAHLARRACFDCHSNETRWPWYTSVAPVSWYTQHDVDEGRAHLNFSEWDRPQKDAHEAADVVAEGEMPPAIYRVAHPEARLSPAERDALIAGLKTTLANSAPGRTL